MNEDEQVNNLFIKKKHCDIFFSSKDVTALRWISELHHLLLNHTQNLTFNDYELQSDYARKKEIYSECIIINDRKVEFYLINKILFELENEKLI